jgi:hypothetical protein
MVAQGIAKRPVAQPGWRRGAPDTPASDSMNVPSGSWQASWMSRKNGFWNPTGRS